MSKFRIAYEEVYGWDSHAMHLSNEVIDGKAVLNVSYAPRVMKRTIYPMLKEVNKNDCTYHLYPQWQKRYATYFDTYEKAQEAIRFIQNDYATMNGIETLRIEEEHTTQSDRS